MKKIIAMACVACLLAGTLSACGKTPASSEEPKPSESPKPSEEPKPSERPVIVIPEEPLPGMRDITTMELVREMGLESILVIRLSLAVTGLNSGATVRFVLMRRPGAVR